LDFNPYDVSTKELVWDGPVAWLERFGIGPPGPVDVIDSDITTLTAAADKVVKVGGPEPYLVNIEFQTYHDTGVTRTLWYRQVALDYRHNLPVLTVLVLLRKEANSPKLVGTYERHMPNGRRTNWYNFEVVRLWEEDPDSFLTAGVVLVPLAPLTDVSEDALPGVVRRMAARINNEPRPQANKLWTATYILMGLRYPDELVTRLLEGVQTMKESTTYQAILREGRTEGRDEGRIEGGIAEARRFLLRMGTKRFGEPDATTLATLEAIQDIDRLEALGERILDVGSQDWDGLLGTA
jgi:predicted transposase YdaD